MRDYQKELADSLDKSDQIAKLEAKVEELQLQLAKSNGVVKITKKLMNYQEKFNEARTNAKISNLELELKDEFLLRMRYEKIIEDLLEKLGGDNESKT